MNTAQINFQVIDQSFSPDEGIKGISGYMGVFKRGPIGKTEVIFSTWTQFQKVYGGLISTSDDPLIVKRLLERGSKVRVCGIRHFTDIVAGTTDAAKSANSDTKIHTLSGALSAGHTATYTVSAVPVSQAFTTDSTTTLKLLGAKIVAKWPSLIDNYYVASGTRLQLSLIGAAGSGGALTVTGTSAPTVTNTALIGFRDSAGVELFTLAPKYYGIDYDKLRISVTPGSNGQTNYFDLRIEFAGDNSYTPELYQNLIIPGSPTVASSQYLKDVVKGSELVDVTYKDLSALTAPIVPLTNYSRYYGGSNGGVITDSDYIGDVASKTGLHSFDNVSDIYAIGCNTSADAVVIAAAAYVDTRKDLQYFHHFDNALVTATQIADAKTALNINSPYVEFWTGGLVVLDPITNLRKNISAIGDILGAAANSEANFGAYRSFVGTQRGLIFNAFGVVNNFGGSSDLTSLNILSNRQVNAVINVDGQIALSGNFSGQLETSHLSFNNVVRLVIHIQKVLRPLIKPYIEEPNDIPTWKNIYLTAKPFMDSLVSPKRALFEYNWQGDQFVASLNDLVVNNTTDVGLGKYKVLLYIKDIVSLQEFNLSIIITDASVSFETTLIQP